MLHHSRWTPLYYKVGAIALPTGAPTRSVVSRGVMNPPAQHHRVPEFFYIKAYVGEKQHAKSRGPYLWLVGTSGKKQPQTVVGHFCRKVTNHRLWVFWQAITFVGNSQQVLTY